MISAIFFWFEHFFFSLVASTWVAQTGASHSRQKESSPRPAVPVDTPKVAAPVGCPPVIQSPMPTSSQWYQPTKGKGGNRTWWNPHGNGAKGKSGGRGGSCFKCGSSDHWSKECPANGAKSKSGGKGGSCFKCASSDHWSNECPANKEPRDGASCRLLPSHSPKGMSVPVSFPSDFPPCVFVPFGGGSSSVYLGWENEDWGLDVLFAEEGVWDPAIELSWGLEGLVVTEGGMSTAQGPKGEGEVFQWGRPLSDKGIGGWGRPLSGDGTGGWDTTGFGQTRVNRSFFLPEMFCLPRCPPGGQFFSIPDPPPYPMERPVLFSRGSPRHRNPSVFVLSCFLSLLFICCFVFLGGLEGCRHPGEMAEAGKHYHFH